MTETEETILAVSLGLGVLWLLVTPSGVGSVAGTPSALAPQPSADPPRQFTQDFSWAIAQAKGNLEGQGEDLSGPCGAWAIINEAVPIIRATGAPVGLLSKPSGNNCNGFSVDTLVYPNGEGYDVLVDSGGANGPSWGFSGFVDPGKYRG